LSRLGRVTLQCTAVVALATGLAACGSKSSSPPPASSGSGSSTTASSGSSAASGSTTIDIKNYKFMPDQLTVKVGSTITVHNMDSTVHTLTATNKAFDTGDIPANGTKTITVSKPGTYPYVCTIHQFMMGTLTVSG